MRNEDVFGVVQGALIRNKTGQHQKNSCKSLAFVFDQLGSEIGIYSA
ncbi:hypothetical protein Mar181_3372 [Marinomonas posidonica IVIA-Po-181]|uniref:Uncharacterized protein n=1 Tax=Marinomonas posidonica (strain CECT 7376 / NCIMB 14433 / IVIA-Po-181) TaxID=491952 RepID=F6CUH0_MARPP|nr:hypothetical protein Mar181_3372 [Marinomonas posidonica IVIA-Po-181]